MKPTRILEDDVKRFAYVGRPGNLITSARQRVTVIIKTTPVCTASVTFSMRADEQKARTIAGTLTRVR